ncbi:hypothetical protein HK100_001308 [Physocladia obscura]|uniref:Protein kinase domain-containing protein n=1 Tax=Physocladia obscura TaxID=109957 RepID=A0AAD5SX01_9FUNG|nr:hypothetical protein HK100_001308 [Physocladia obscura]
MLMSPPPESKLSPMKIKQEPEFTESTQTISGYSNYEQEDATSATPFACANNPVLAEQNTKKLRLIFGVWILGKTIGTGSSGSVRLVIHKDIGKKCVVKCIKRQADQPNQPPASRSRDGIALREHFMLREALVGLSLDHPNIAKMHSCFFGRNHFYFFCELAEGMDFARYLLEKGILQESNARFVFIQLLNAVDYIHKCNPYRGPEVDIWSLGVCLYGMVHDSLPFNHSALEDLLDSVVNGIYEIPDHFSLALKILITRILAVESSNRVTIAEILVDPWVLNVVSSEAPTLCNTNPRTSFQRKKAFYRSNADPGIFERIKFESTGTVEHSRQIATSLEISLQNVEHESKKYAFELDWVEIVLRMERHKRAEFLMREVEKRSGARKWSLEREWRIDVAATIATGKFQARNSIFLRANNIVFIEAPNKALLSSSLIRKKLQIFSNLANSIKNKLYSKTEEAAPAAEMATPTPVKRSKNLIKRVFRKPLNSVAENSASTTNWIPRKISPFSFVSKWNMRTSRIQENQAMSHIPRMFRAWSVIPSFLDDHIKPNLNDVSKPSDLPKLNEKMKSNDVSVTQKSSKCIPSDKSNPAAVEPLASIFPAAEQLTYSRQVNFPAGVLEWWQKRFEIESLLKSKRNVTSNMGVSDVNGAPGDDFEFDDNDDAESFEGLEPSKTGESLFACMGRRFKN